MGVSNNETFAENLEIMINQKLKNRGHTFEVLNFGVPGFNIHDEIEFFEEKGLKYRPDLAVVVYVCDDVEDNWEMSKLADEGVEKIKKEKGEVTKKDFYALFNNVTRTERQITEINFEERWERIVMASLKRLSYLSKSHNFTVLLAYNGCPEWPYINEKGKLSESAQNLELNFLDLSLVHKGRYNEEVLLRYPDGHYNQKGHKIIANILYEWISKFLMKNGHV